MIREVRGQVMTFQLDLDQVVGQRPLISVQHSVTVHVSQLPHLGHDTTDYVSQYCNSHTGVGLAVLCSERTDTDERVTF